ncbi:MAG: peptide ABC transporter substrate-binding protein [Pseudobutyrivibrio sp.]|nr:peptide ABC transporter substrate-binding protein [Pseudobutyrivibrio sp.]
MKKKLIAVLLVASMAASMVACGNKNSGSASKEAAAPAEATTVNTDTTTLKINLASEPDYLDPALNSSVDGATLACNSFVGLYTYDETDTPVPALADGEPEISEDGLHYTFKMIESKWSNGEEVTANDFVYSWNRAVAEETAADYAYMFAPIATNDDGTLKIEATDDYTLEVELNAPCAYFYDLLAFPAFMPVYQPEVEAANTDGTKPGAWCQDAGFTCNGAYTLTDWKHNESMTYTKNPNFYRADDVKIEKLEFMLSADDTAIYAAYNAGDLDFVDTHIPADEIETLKNSAEFNVVNTLGTYYVGFNVNSKIFDGLTKEQAVEMRQALSLLIDRQWIVDTVEPTEKTPADTFIPDGMNDGNGGTFEAEDAGYYDATATGANNIEEAVKLLEDCGYSFTENGDGTYAMSPALELTYLTNPSTKHEAVAALIQQDWGKVGISVKVETEDWNVFLEDRKAGKFDVAREGWIADFNDPINMLEMWVSYGGNNDMQFGKNPAKAAPDWTEYDELIQEIYTQTDYAKRAELMHKAEDMLMSTYAVVPVWFENNIYLQKSNVTGIIACKNMNKYFMYAEKTAE